MSKATLPFKVPQSEFVPAEFVTSSEVDGVPPKHGRNDCDCDDYENCEECAQRLKEFRENARRIRTEWKQERQRKMKEMGINK